MGPNPRVYNGWLWTGQTVNSKWRFRKLVGEKWITVDVAVTLSLAPLQAALDAADPSKGAPASTAHAPVAAPK